MALLLNGPFAANGHMVQKTPCKTQGTDALKKSTENLNRNEISLGKAELSKRNF